MSLFAVQHERLVGTQVHVGLDACIRVVGQQAGETVKIHRARPVGLGAVEVVDHNELFAAQRAAVGQDAGIFLVQRLEVASD